MRTYMKFIGAEATDYPRVGQCGFAWKATGFDDEEDCEYRAYLFQPDGDENAYYVDADSLEPTPTIGGLTPEGRFCSGNGSH